jgi:hypothetical protein
MHGESFFTKKDVFAGTATQVSFPLFIPMKFQKFRLVGISLLVAAAPSARAALTSISIINAGFNDQSGWFAINDAVLGNSGGAEPGWSWNTPVTSTVVLDFSETVLPLEGSGMGLTYGGLDRFTQPVTLTVSGDYEFKVKANAIEGMSIGVGYEKPLSDGIFVFYSVGVRGSPLFRVAAGDGWKEYSWTTNLEAGTHQIAIGNPSSGTFAIAFDEFSLTRIPETSTSILSIISIGALVTYRRRV